MAYCSSAFFESGHLADSMISYFAGPLPVRWQLVWCHERCYKTECDEKRQALSNTAQCTGGELVCFKKSKKFEEWLEGNQGTPYILLADWREVKPCLQVAVEQLPCNRPVYTLVLAEVPSQHERAVAWAQSLPRFVPLQVRQEFSTVIDMITLLASRVHMDTLMPATLMPPQQAGLEAHDPETASSSGSIASDLSLALANLQEWSPWKVDDWDLTLEPAADLLLSFGKDGLGKHCSAWEVLSPLQEKHSPARLEEILKEAMPDHYEE